MENSALYYDRSNINAESLEKILLSTILFSERVYLNNRCKAATPNIEKKLCELSEASLLWTWSFPRESLDPQAAVWSKENSLTVMPDESYLEYANAISEAISEFRARSEKPNMQGRLTDLVQLSNELWGTSIAAFLQSQCLVASGKRVGPMFDRIERADYEHTVAQRFLALNGIYGNLSLLSVADILYLRKQYQSKMHSIITEAAVKWPVALGEQQAITRASEELMSTYVRELEEFLQRRRSKSISKQVIDLSINILGIVMWPVGLWGIYKQVKDYFDRRSDLPLQWFLLDIRGLVESHKIDSAKQSHLLQA
jgi:hypothetical protein